MGGRCAEELVFGEMTNGASNDIERATSLARNMVCNWGMSTKLGPINYHKSGISPFADIREHTDYSERTGTLIDEEIKEIVSSNYQRAMNILVNNREKLERLAEALIIWETLDSKQISDLMEGIDIGLPLINRKSEIEVPVA